MKVKSKDSFIDLLHEDSAWRKHELSVMRSQVDSAKGKAKHSMIRAAIVILYSHWEGHIKKAGNLYISYLNFLGLKYDDMSDNNLIVGIFSKFNGENKETSYSAYKKYTDFISGKNHNGKFSVNSDNVIKTKCNLKLDVLCEILAVIGINDTYFIANKIFIDEQLLKYRNSIAHGEDTRWNDETKVDEESYKILHEKIVELISAFDTDIANHVALEKFKKTPSKAF